MKQKLFTLLLALLVVAGFQAKAQTSTPALVLIQAGDSLPNDHAADFALAGGPPNVVAGLPDANERGNYAGLIDVFKHKLTWDANAATATNGSSKWRYRKGDPSIKSTSTDRIYVSQPVAGTKYVSFSTSATGANKLSIRDAGGTLHDQFVVFMSKNPEVCVHDFYTPGLARDWNSDGLAITPQDFNNGNFQGFLAIQATGYVDDPELLIVVHNKAGELSLMTYQDYVKTLNANSISSITDYRRQFFPLYIKSEPFAGRWARPSDFEDEDCSRFFEFFAPNAAQGKDMSTLAAYSAEEVALGTKKNPFSVFSVRQVDYIRNSETDPLESTLVTGARNEIIFGTNYDSSDEAPNTVTFQGIHRDYNDRPWLGCTHYGTAPQDVDDPLGSGPITDSIIPIFILQTPEDNCKVLSISRQNKFKTISQRDGNLADMIEIRDFASYYKYYDEDVAGSLKVKLEDGSEFWYHKETVDCAGSTVRNSDGFFDEDYIIYQTYTNLQKFAIWIDDAGRFILFPVATYFWEYGQSDEEMAFADDNILPNSVLLWNDIMVRYREGYTPATEANKAWGAQIGWWNGNRTAGLGQYPLGDTDPYLGVIPLDLRSSADYDKRAFDLICMEDDAPQEGRFFFLELQYPDTLGVSELHQEFWDKNYDYNYNYDRKYVLATQLWDDPDGSGTSKHLVAVPKEVLRKPGANEGKYWMFPYDSVNMAAHWEVKKAADGAYMLINMLGDTLQYNIIFGTTPLDYGVSLSGGNLPVNGYIPGAPYYGNCSTSVDHGYFGRINHTEDNDMWFERNNVHSWNWAGSPYPECTWNTWNFFKLKPDKQFGMTPDGKKYDKDAFFMELNVPSNAGYSVRLKADANWTKSPWGMVGADFDGGFLTYWQKNIDLEFIDASVNKYDCHSDFPSCFGLLIKLEPIYYVPNHGTFYPGDRGTEADVDKDIVNTNYDKFQYQDSLTAYTFLTGVYDIKEALDVENKLILGSKKVTYNGRTVDAASLVNFDSPNQLSNLEFIPLFGDKYGNSKVGQDRIDAIEIAASGGQGHLRDCLYGETYKWYIIYDSKLKKYLTFDTINASATVNRERVGLVFGATYEIDAVPVRFYQPLVGDKEQTNFLIQFYMPVYKYKHVIDGKEYTYRNEFPDIESTISTATIDPSCAEVLFATLNNQSDILYSTAAYSRTTTATRFTIVVNPKDPCECVGEFIKPKWLAEERLLNLPLNNQVWVGKEAKDIWIATGKPVAAKDFLPIYKGEANTGNSAIVVIPEDTEKATTLTHTYVTSINDRAYWGWLPANKGKVYIPIPGQNNTASTSGDTGLKAKATIGPKSTIVGEPGFYTDTIVPLYYVQNDDELYLTVVPLCDLQDERATVYDVSGVKLQWRKKIEWSETVRDSLGYDPRALQLFAISGCEVDPIDGWYGKFVYLPLASYIQDYKQGKLVNYEVSAGKEVLAVDYNFNLGKMADYDDCPGNDITSCWRVSQYTTIGTKVQDLVVFNSNGTEIAGNFVPVEFKLSKRGYIQPDCDYFLVQNSNKWFSATVDNRDKFYTFDGFTKIDIENEDAPYLAPWKLSAHWELNLLDEEKDEFLYVFEPELKKIYNEPIETYRTQLDGEYYFFKYLNGTKEGDDVITVRSINVAGYEEGIWTALYDTLTLRCVDHGVPFFDLEADGLFDINGTKLAILETPYTDRNLGYLVPDEKAPYPDISVPILDGDEDIIGWQAFIKMLDTEANFKDAEFLNVYRQNRRYLTEDHMIPYYSFSISKTEKDEKGKDVINEYFLTVDPEEISTSASVYWKAITPTQKEWLADPETYADKMKLFKFCLPYKLNKNGTKAELVPYCETGYHPVYLQTLDTKKSDDIFLVIAGSATKYVTHRNLNDAVIASAKAEYLKHRIYSMEYLDDVVIDPVRVTGWIFGGPTHNGNIWVPINDVIAEIGNTKEGVLTDYKLYNLDKEGITFITESKDDPNYAIFTGVKNAPTLTLEFEGDTTIGNWIVRPIWYYRVSLTNDDGDTLYLTDAMDEGGEFYTFKGEDHFYALFSDLLDNEPDYVAENIFADKNFSQTFGFRYVIDEFDPDQSFYVVSHADYTRPKEEGLYRFLAEVNNHMIFLDDKEYALVFQWGDKTEDGYVNLEVVGKGGIYGVEGGVKLLNTTGKVDIYSIDGRLITSTILNGNETTIPASRGIAIVKNGSNVVKVVVK